MKSFDLDGTALRMELTLARQREAFLRAGPPSLKERKADLRALKATILAHRDAIADAVKADFGHRSPHETALMELLPVVQGINYQLRNLRRWMRPEKRHVPLHFLPGRAWVVCQPLGVVGIMSPWNYPMSLALMPLATAIAAGNRAMIKPSEFTPASSALLAKMLAETFPSDQVAVVTGDAAVGKDFSALPFDHLVFTGSTQVGRAVMKAASDNLVPLTLELGGKSPVIIERGHSMQHAAAGIAYGKLGNGGQTCIAPDYVMVHEDAVPAFADAYDQAVRKLYPDGPASDNYTSVINERHYERLRALLDDARAHGATVREVGVNAQRAGARPHNLTPTLVTGVTQQMRLMREEVFGPLLPVVGYRQLDEAIAYVNAHPRPLALYYFGSDAAQCRKVLSLTTSGNVTVNNTLMHYAQDDLPFGGVGPSGMGAYHGTEGFKSLSHAKGVFKQGRWNLSALLRPPYGALAELALKIMLR
ncbi:MAG: coniferyl aldehyde dehydrogenase [Massilia sp.]